MIAQYISRHSVVKSSVIPKSGHVKGVWRIASVLSLCIVCFILGYGQVAAVQICKKEKVFYRLVATRITNDLFGD